MQSRWAESHERMPGANTYEGMPPMEYNLGHAECLHSRRDTNQTAHHSHVFGIKKPDDVIATADRPEF